MSRFATAFISHKLNQNIHLTEGEKPPHVRFFCVYCGSHLQVGTEHSGRVSECPHCLHVTPVPDTTRNGTGSRRAYIYPPEVLGLDIVFLCPRCRSRLRIDARDAGTIVLCPPCNDKIRVPDLPLFVETGPHPREENRALPPVPSARLSPEEIEFLSRAEVCHEAFGAVVGAQLSSNGFSQ